MSGDDVSGSGVRVLESRVISLEARLKTLEGIDRDDRTRESDRYTEILMQLSALGERMARVETRVGFIAAGAGVISSILVVAAKSMIGG